MQANITVYSEIKEMCAEWILTVLKKLNNSVIWPIIYKKFYV